MAEINFPDNPDIDEVYMSGNSQWKWNGTFWRAIGTPGPQGEPGYTGSAGINGYTGSQGDIGYTGSVGSQGVIGYTGSKGADGSGGTGTAGLQDIFMMMGV